MLVPLSIAALSAALMFLQEARQLWWLYILATGIVWFLRPQVSVSNSIIRNASLERQTTSPGIRSLARPFQRLANVALHPFKWFHDMLDNFGPLFIGVLMAVVWGGYETFMFFRAIYSWNLSS